MNLSVRDAANTAPDQIALIDERGALTFRELAALADEAVREHATDGARIFVAPRLTREHVALLLGLLEHDVPFALTHPRWTSTERETAVARCEAVPAAEALLVFTSGSAGRPKIVRLSRRALEAAATAHAETLPWRPDDRWLALLPLAHVGGLSVLTRSLHARRAVVLCPPPFEPEKLLRLIEAHRVTLLSLVPTMLEPLARGKAPASLRAVLLGGAASRPALIEEARANGWPVLPTWGMSETCAQVCTQRLGDEREIGVGPPLPGMQVRARDGHIEVAGASLMEGYLDDASTVAEGWFRSGDLGRLDDEGHLHVLGRADEQIITGGENVDPAEVEAALLEHASIVQACVWGEPDDTWGQVVVAAIVVRGPLDLARHLSDRLARFKHPRQVHERETLPRLPSGKVDRRALRGAGGVPERVL